MLPAHLAADNAEGQFLRGVTGGLARRRTLVSWCRTADRTAAGGTMSGGFPDGTTLDTVVDTMGGLVFAPDDGVRYFNQLYTEVTRAVAQRVATDSFKDKPFMVALDVEFAGLYLDAARSPATAPRARA